MFNGSLRTVPVSKLKPGKNLRGREESVDDLVESLRRAPQLQTVLVRPKGRDYEVIAGQRRLRAAQQLGVSHLDVKVVEADDLQAEAFGLVENLHRKKFANEAKAIARLVEIYRQLEPQPKRGRKPKHENGGHGGRNSIGAIDRVAALTGKSARATRRLAKVGGSDVFANTEGRRPTLNEAERMVSAHPRKQRYLEEQQRAERQIRRAVESLEVVAKVLGEVHVVSSVEKDRLLALAMTVSKAATRLKVKPPAAAAVDVSQAVDFIEKTHNRKLAPVMLKADSGGKRPHFIARPPFMSTTTTSLATCPPTCSLKGNGCYATSGFAKFKQARLDDAGSAIHADAITRAEAETIDKSFGGGAIPQDGARGGRDLRLHVGGDIRSATGARVLALAARRWRDRGGGSVFTFTHSWRSVPRRAWGESIRVLASIEDAADAAAARRQGYAPALVVDRFPSEKVFTVAGSAVSWIPCPAETTGQVCTSCRICLDRDLYAERMGVAFQAHGQGAQRVRDQLVPLRLPRRATAAAPHAALGSAGRIKHD